MNVNSRDTMPDQIGIQGVMGKATLNGLTVVTVPCPSITANSLVFTSLLVASGTLGVVVVSGITPGVGFGVVSVLLNASTIAWLVANP